MKNAVLPNVSSYPNVYYISQDNYYIADLSLLSKKTIYYCDSITSCIAIIVIGYSKKEQAQMVAISHLSGSGRFKHFFQLLSEVFERNPVAVYAYGANPAEDRTPSKEAITLNNTLQVLQWISSNSLSFSQLTLHLGTGNPSHYDHNKDCCAFIWNGSDHYEVSSTRYYLTESDRDPTGGLQLLFCKYGNPNSVRLQSDAFSKEEIDELVAKGKKDKLDSTISMSNNEILAAYASMPEYEVPWFCDSVRQAGNYVKQHSESIC